MKKRKSKATLKDGRPSGIWLPFYLIGHCTLILLCIYKDAYKKLLYALLKAVKIIGWATAYFLEKVGEITIFLVVTAIRIPSLPFLWLLEIWLVLTNPEIKRQKIKKIKNGYSRFQKNLKNSPDSGLHFCYNFIGTPVRTLATFSLILFTIGSFYVWVLKDLPSPYRLKQAPALTTRIYARDCQTLLYKIFRNENRTLVPLNQIPAYVREATVAVEDKEFYNHHGYSFTGILRAFGNNLAQRRVQGGSTITQQLIKNAVLSNEKSYRRKIKELFLALETEMIFTKDQILQMYLNEVAYGGPAYGIEAAAQMYFGKSVKELDLSEAAFLAGLPAAPSQFSPYLAGMTAAKSRQKEVLTQMVKANFISLVEARRAYVKELHVLDPQNPIKAPHFVMFVRDELINKYGEEKVTSGGLTVCTTLDPAAQELAEKTVSEEIAKIRKPYNVNNGAA